MEPDIDEAPSQLGPFALLWVAAVVALNWFIYALPAAAALSAGVDIPLATGTTLALASVDPDAGTIILSGGLAMLAVAGVLVHMVARALLPEERAPAPLLGKLVALGVFGALALPAEWCVGGLIPDVFSVAPVLSVAAVIGVVVPILLVVASVQGAASLLLGASRNAFFGGIVATLGTLLLAPPAAAAASLWLLVQAADAASEPRAPERIPMEVGAVGLLGSHGGQTHSDIDDCFHELEQVRAQVEQVVRSSYSLSTADAEDVASEAMIAVCVSDSLSSYLNLAAVYTKAAKNKAVDLRRKRKGDVGVEPALCLPFYPDDWRLPSELVVADLALGRLDRQMQDALRLWSHDESHRAIATKLGITERKSRDLVGNGLKSMRGYVAKQCAYREVRAR